MEVTLSSFRKRFTYDPDKDLLGKGGFGEVYKAYDNEDKIFVALKIYTGSSDSKYNLINEVKRFKKLRHPNIVEHIEAYEVSTGSNDIHGKPIIYQVGVLEYADKGTLADLLKKGTPDYRFMEDLAKDIINGLAYLHSQNIIHRDLKPTNILLFSEGDKLRAKITDFGIAKNIDATAASTQLVGTVEYMAPEFFTTGIITPASDMWSLGVMLLEAITGVHPFGKTSQGLSNEQIINNILNKDISTTLQNTPAGLKEIITKCLIRQPNLRPQSAVEIKSELTSNKENPFGDKTQIIGIMPIKKSVKKLRWKKMGIAFFDFDFGKGNRGRIAAKEFILFLSMIILGLFFPFIIALINNTVANYKETEYHNLANKNQYLVNSIFHKIDRQFIFSNYYFGFTQEGMYYYLDFDFGLTEIDSIRFLSGIRWKGNGFDTIHLLTPIGFIQMEIDQGYHYKQNKDFFDLGFRGRPLSDELPIVSYDLNKKWGRYLYFDNFAHDIISSLPPLEGNEIQSDIRIAGSEEFDIGKEINSVSNLDVYSNRYLFPSKAFTYEFLPNRIEDQLNINGWVEWFIKHRADSIPKFKSYLLKHDAYSPTKFKSFCKNYILFSTNEKENLAKIDSLCKIVDTQDSISLKFASCKIPLFNPIRLKYHSIILPQYSKYLSASILLLFIIFYPIRIFLILLIWAIKTLRNS